MLRLLAMLKGMKKPVIVFDLGGVLIDWNPRYLYRKIFGSRVEEMELFLSDVCNQSWNEQQDEGRSFQEAIEVLVQRFPQHRENIEIYFSRWPEMLGGPISETVTVLQDLNRNGYALLALSNWSAETFPHAQTRFDFLQVFRKIYLSGEVRLKKPDARFYQMLLTGEGVAPEQTLFIDDVIANVQAARLLGINSIHFKSGETLRHELRDFGILL